jgi:hypothetical protein
MINLRSFIMVCDNMEETEVYFKTMNDIDIVKTDMLSAYRYFEKHPNDVNVYAFKFVDNKCFITLDIIKSHDEVFEHDTRFINELIKVFKE